MNYPEDAKPTVRCGRNATGLVTNKMARLPLSSNARIEKAREEIKTDRRQSPRYVPNHDVFVIFSPNYTRLGKLKDVSSSGAAFEYAVLGENEEILDSAVDIFASKPDRFLLSRVSCRVVYDTKTEQPTFGGIETRRCGLKFENLSQQQSELLNLLLVKYMSHPRNLNEG